ncbi:MAG: TolC family protein [Cyanobacteriota bacterium]
MSPESPRPCHPPVRRRRGRLAHRLSAALLFALPPGPAALAAPLTPAAAPPVAELERSWRELEQQLRELDRILPPEALPPSESAPAGFETLRSAAAASGAGRRPLGLEEALAIAFQANPSLLADRQEVAAAAAELQGRLGRWWPRVSAVAGVGQGQEADTFTVPRGNGGLGLGPNFAAGGLRAADGRAVDGPFYVPSGGEGTLTTGTGQVGAGLEVDWALVDFARTPAIRAARERLRQARSAYATRLRELQLKVSEAYYQLQKADQLVRIREADLRNDITILAEVLDLQRAGLVPRLDELRRRAIEATNQERLVQALADQAVARRRLAVLLDLPAQTVPAAGDPIRLQPRWPLDLDRSLLEAYRDNPELEAILATREALARDRDATAAALLPRLSLFAAAGGDLTRTDQWNIQGDCCGSAVIPSLTTAGSDWSVGLTLRWLLSDGGSTAAEARALARRADAQTYRWAARRNDIQLRLEQAFFQHEASLASLSAARRGVVAALEAFRDVKLRYRTGLASEVELSLTQDQLISSLVQRLSATVDVNLTDARLLRELLPMPRDPAGPVPARLTLEPGPAADRSGAGP